MLYDVTYQLEKKMCVHKTLFLYVVVVWETL